MTDTSSPTAITVGGAKNLVRFSYEHIFESVPKRNEKGEIETDDNGKEIREYSLQIRIPKTDLVTKAQVDAAISAAGLDFHGKKWPAIKNSPLSKLCIRDGDKEAELKEDPTLVGQWFFNARTYKKPRVVGPRKNPTTQKFDQLPDGSVKSGDYGKVAVTFKGFDKKGGIGVSAQLGNIQFLLEGDPLGGQHAAESDFDDEDDFDGADSTESVL